MTPIQPAATSQARLVADLEAALQQLIIEHRKLLKMIENQQAAMKVLDLKAMDQATQQQEASRLRIATTEHKRRSSVLALARSLRLAGEPKTPRRIKTKASMTMTPVSVISIEPA